MKTSDTARLLFPSTRIDPTSGPAGRFPTLSEPWLPLNLAAVFRPPSLGSTCRIVLRVKDAVRWFHAFAEVPGAQYPGDPKRRATLPNHDAKPEVHDFEVHGRRVMGLWWSTPEGSTSASPVQRIDFSGAENGGEVRERVLNALELPGQVMDYHFAIQGAVTLLHKRRFAEPQHLSFMEWLCWLDIVLLEANEASFRISEDNPTYVHVPAFNILLDVYENEGFLMEALPLVERFARFFPENTVESVRVRARLLREESSSPDIESSSEAP